MCHVWWTVRSSLSYDTITARFEEGLHVRGCDGVGRVSMPGRLRETARKARCPVDRSLSMVVVHIVVATEALSPFAQAIGGYTRCDSNRIQKITADAGRTLAGLHTKGFPPAESWATLVEGSC